MLLDDGLGKALIERRSWGAGLNRENRLEVRV